MKTENKNQHKDRSRSPESNLNRDIHRNLQEERFPEANLAKESREDAADQQKKDQAMDELAADVAKARDLRSTDKSVEDIAGVSDLDHGMRRAEES
jgi:hypothetical protein